MLDTIKEKLRQIEERENIRILHCVESGSRAWGFASADSDYDVRFVYLRPREYYLRLDRTRDVIEWRLDDTLDINGWDLQKALRLAHNSNPTVFEWLASPIVYKTTEQWREVSSVIEEYFEEKSGLYHYLSTAKRNYHKFFKGDRVKLKKYFYVLRPLLACKWILAEGTPPPMLFRDLMDKHLDTGIKPQVEELLRMKTEMPEMGEGSRLPQVDEYIDKTMAEVERLAAALPDKEARGWEKLNSLFLKLI